MEREALQNSETQEIYYKDDAGEVFAASPEEAQEAFRSGYKPLTPEELQKVKRIERFGDQPVKAMVGGGLSALTGGLLDVALQQAGAAEVQQGLQEFNPVAWATGDIGTTVGTAIFAMGSGTLGKLAGKTFPGIVAKQSLKIEKELAKKFVKAGISQSGAKILSRGMGGSIDALAYSLKDAISEEALGDPEFNAEKMLAEFGLKAIVNVPIGFGLGGTIAFGEVAVPKLLGKTALKTKAGLEQYKKRIKNNANDVKEIWAKEFPQSYEKNKVLLEDPFGLEGKKIRTLAEEFSVNANRQEAATRAYKNYRQLYDALEETRGAWEKTQRTQEIGRLAEESLGYNPVKEGIAQTQLRDTLNKIRTDVAKILEREKGISDRMIKNALKELDRYEAVAYQPNVDSNKFIRNLIKAKQDLRNDYVKPNIIFKDGKIIPNQTKSSPDYYAAEIIEKNIIKPIDDFMSNQAVWGKGGVRQAKGDELYVKYLRVKEKFNEMWGKKKSGPTDSKFYTNLNLINRRDSEYFKVLDEYQDVALEFQEFFIDTARNLGKQIPENEIKRLVNQSADDMGLTMEGFELGSRLSSLEAATLRKGEVGDVIVDGIERKILPAYLKQVKDLAVDAFKKEKRPDQMFKVIARREKALSVIDDKIDNMIRRFSSGKTIDAAEITRVDKINKFSKTTSGSLLANIISKVGDDIESIHHFASDEGQMIEAINKNLAPMSEYMPNHSAILAAKAYEDIKFLASKAPKNPFSEAQIKAGKIDWQPSPSEMSKFNRYYQALDNPLVFLKDISEGKLNKEALEVLQQRRPALYTHIIEKLADYLGQNKDKIPYQKRVLIGRIIGVDLDYISNKRYVLGLQQNFKKPKAIDKGVDGLRDTGLSKLDQAKANLTSTQKIERGIE